MVVVDREGVHLGSILTSASPAEVKLPEKTLDPVNFPRAGQGRPKNRPKRHILSDFLSGVQGQNKIGPKVE
ncbi:MAG: hypothetical protein V2B19_29240 [Pseudomonadota bacterium]